MNIRIDEKNKSRIAVISSNKLIIKNTQDALDLMITAQDNVCEKIIVNKENIINEFFELRTGIAGEILQKYINYNIKIAIVGEFDYLKSKSLKDFIYECNNGKQIFFMSTVQDAIEKLHSV